MFDYHRCIHNRKRSQWPCKIKDMISGLEFEVCQDCCRRYLKQKGWILLNWEGVKTKTEMESELKKVPF